MKKSIKKRPAQNIGQLSEDDVTKGIGLSVALGASSALLLNGLWIMYKLRDETLDYQRTLKSAGTVDLLVGAILLMGPAFMALKK